MDNIKKSIDILAKIQIIIACIFLVAFIFCVILQIVSRYIPGVSVLWASQMASYLFIWAILMASAVGVYNKSHFSMNGLAEKLKGRVGFANKLMIQLVIAIFGVMLTYYGSLLVQDFWNWSINSIPSIKQRYVWGVLPVTGFTITIYSVSNLIQEILEYKKLTKNDKGGQQC